MKKHLTLGDLVGDALGTGFANAIAAAERLRQEAANPTGTTAGSDTQSKGMKGSRE